MDFLLKKAALIGLFASALIIIYTKQVTNDALLNQVAKIESDYEAQIKSLDTKVARAKEALATPDRVIIEQSRNICGKTRTTRKEDYSRNKIRLVKIKTHRDSMMSIYSNQRRIKLGKINAKLSHALSKPKLLQLLRPFIALRPYVFMAFLTFLILVVFFYRIS